MVVAWCLLMGVLVFLLVIKKPLLTLFTVTGEPGVKNTFWLHQAVESGQFAVLVGKLYDVLNLTRISWRHV
jgi:hypothetical protein